MRNDERRALIITLASTRTMLTVRKFLIMRWRHLKKLILRILTFLVSTNLEWKFGLFTSVNFSLQTSPIKLMTKNHFTYEMSVLYDYNFPKIVESIACDSSIKTLPQPTSLWQSYLLSPFNYFLLQRSTLSGILSGANRAWNTKTKLENVRQEYYPSWFCRRWRTSGRQAEWR